VLAVLFASAAAADTILTNVYQRTSRRLALFPIIGRRLENCY
jgi:hypothetical protein